MNLIFTCSNNFKSKLRLCVFLASCMVLFFDNRTCAQSFVHPGVPFTRADLDQLKGNITREPWLSGYNALLNDAHAKLSYGPKGPFATVTRAPNLNNSAWIDDMTAIHDLAFMYVFTGDSAYARKATNLLDAWAVTNTTWGGGENMLDIGDMAPYFVAGADILRSTFPGWSSANNQHVNNYFRNVLYPTSYVPGPLRDNNKGALQLQIAVGIAAYLGDATMWQQAIEVYRMDAGGGLRCSLPNGEVGDSGRDDHWFVQIQALGWSAEVAWKQGIDLFSELNNRLLAIGELYPQYSQAPNTVNFIPFGGYAAYWTNWGIPPGYIRQSPFFNIIKGAYSLRKGIPTPYTEQMRTLAGEGAWSFLYLKSADTSHATPMAPVVYPADHTQPVSNLTSIDIGSTGISGNAAYTNGIWTANGAGKSTADAVDFTFKQVTGDAGMIVKIESNSMSTATTGLMIRESLATTANYVSVNLSAAGAGSSSKGSTASTNYTHYQPKAPWWLKIERIGNRVFTYHSQDGINWSNNALFIITLPANVYIGFYTISNNTSVLNREVLSNVAISNSSPPGAPVVTSATSAAATVGSAFSYTITANGNPTSFHAAGLPAGLVIDTLSGTISGSPTVAGQSIVALQANNASGSGTATFILNTTGSSVPAAPAGITAAVINGFNISLTWQGVPNASTYSVKRSLNANGPFTVIQSGITATSFVDAAPMPEVSNYYVVTALTGSLESPNSAIVSASVPPATPNPPVITDKNKEIDLSWNSAPGATTYNVKRSALSGGPYITIANVNTTSYADLNVSNGSPYYYVVSSVGQTKEGANSAESFGVPGSTSYTWSSQAESDSLKLAQNWLENAIPATPAIITFQASADTVLTNDIQSLGVSRIQFGASANSYTIGGSVLHLRNDLVNNATSYQTLSMPVVLDTLLNVNTPGVNGTVALTGTVSGTGSLMKNGIGFVYLSGNNTYSGGTILNGNGQSWPPVYGTEVSGTSSGAPSAPTSGPLGTGKITMNGGALFSVNADATLYNDIEIAAGKTSYFYQTTNALNLYGRLTGSGTIIQDGNVYAGLHLFADNSSFTGTFVSKLRSGNSRVRFEVPQSGSANAYWNLDANGNDCQAILFAAGTINFGALAGRGAIRTDGGGSPTISIGALNQSTSYGGTMTGTMNVEKVGTGVLTFTGNQAYSGTTTIRNGTFLLNNSATSGTFTSPVTVESGSFGGTGKSTATLTIGTSAGAGALLEPGNQAVGTLIAGALTLKSDATYNVEINLGTAVGDKMSVPGITLANNPKLSVSAIMGTLTLGTNFTIIDNTGSNPVAGIFKNQPENSLISAGGYNFLVTYKGGTGNDVQLLDERVLPMTITSSLTDTVVTGRSYAYQIGSTKSPNSFSAAGLPPGWTINTATGFISGMAPGAGSYTITITASNDTGQVSGTLNLTVQSNNISGVLAAAGDMKNILEWNPVARSNYNVKRSTTTGGPYQTLATTGINRYTDNNVSNGSTYYYVIALADSTGEGPASTEALAKPNLGQTDYYSFDEPDGTRGIDSWGAKHALLQATATRAAGKYGQALKLDGSATAYATLPVGIISSLSDFTVSTWVKMDAIANWMRVFDFGSSTTQFMYLSVQTGVTGGKSIMRYSIRNGGAEQQVNYNYAFPLNTWVQLAVTRSGNTCTLYINGSAVANNTNITYKPSDLGNTTLNYLGKSQSNDPLLKGSIDEFKIYSRALTASEIADGLLADQTITFSPIAQQKAGNADFSPSAISSSGLPVIYSSSDTTVASIIDGRIHIKSGGSSIITATQPGNTDYKAAIPVTQTLVVIKNDQTITFASFTPGNVGDADIDLSAVSSSGLPVTFTSSDSTVAVILNGKIHITGAGSSIIMASQSGNNSFNAAMPVNQTLTINKLAQTITFNVLQPQKVGDPDVALAASASSGLPVIYASSDPAVATIVSGKLHITGAGTTTITATQTGSDVYSPVSVHQIFAVSKINLQVQYLDGDNGQVTNNTVRPYLKLANLDSVGVDYNEITIRYWLTAENYTGINTWIDYAQLGSGSVNMRYVQLDQPRSGAFGYVEYSFNTTSVLAPNGNSGPIQSRFANQDWSNLNEADDYSFKNASANYVINDHITVYRNGLLIAGLEPAAITPAISFQVAYQNQNTSASGNSISTFLAINNTGNMPVAYGDITARYWFTADGNQSLNYWKDYVKMGSGNITGTFSRLTPARTSADNYLELQISAAAGTFYPLSSTGNIQYRITKADWSAFNEANDYSYAAKAPMAANEHITIYYKGQLIYGAEPSGGLTTLAAFNSSVRMFQPETDLTTDKTILYPNPLADNYFSIRTQNDLLNQDIRIRVRDSFGRIFVDRQMGRNSSGVIRVQLNSTLPIGVYLVQINELPSLKLEVR